MDTHRLFFLGGRLGARIHPTLIYFFLAYQLVVSALVFLFDAGLPLWIVWLGWGMFVLILGAYALREQRGERTAEVRHRTRKHDRLKRIHHLKQQLDAGPAFRTACATCVHAAGGGTCRIDPAPGDRRFRFHHGDEKVYCLFWHPASAPRDPSQPSQLERQE